MYRVVALALGLVLVTAPVRADHEMRQSPLMMRRAGPSCQPGNLQGDYNAGYRYQLGPCAGPYTGPDGETGEGRRTYRRARPY